MADVSGTQKFSLGPVKNTLADTSWLMPLLKLLDIFILPYRLTICPRKAGTTSARRAHGVDEDAAVPGVGEGLENDIRRGLNFVSLLA